MISTCDECEKEFELDKLEDWKCFNCRTMIEVVEFSVPPVELLEYLDDGMTPDLKRKLKKHSEDFEDEFVMGFYFRIYEKSKKPLGENINYMIWIIDDYYDEASNLIMKRMNYVNESSCFAAWLCNFDDEEYFKSISITSILNSINKNDDTKKIKMIEDVLVRMNKNK